MTYRLPLVLSLILVAGCSTGDSPVSSGPIDENAPPDLLVKNAVENRASLSSLAGSGVMRIVDKPNRFGLTVNAAVLADESDRLRIRADKLAGAVQAFDVVKLGDDIGFYVPSQRTLYHGKVEDLRYFAFRFDPDEVLRQMLRPDTSLLIKKWRHAASRAGDSGESLVMEEDVPGNRPRLRLTLERRTGRIASLVQLDSGGDPILVRSYGDYRGLDGGVGAGSRRKAGPVFPYLISFAWPRDNRLMEMRFRTVEGNAVVLDEDFDIAASADTKYLPLSEAEMESESTESPVALASPPLALANLPSS
ncbi:MAG: hypothetical protein LBU64_01015 [Planctomycetota bacterium]|jgi:hypothetical protein|nr:hypothetical protein [Planctomycetota bacterium]